MNTTNKHNDRIQDIVLRARTGMGKSQTEFARVINLSQPQISWLESGKYVDLRMTDLLQLAEACGVTVEYMFIAALNSLATSGYERRRKSGLTVVVTSSPSSPSAPSSLIGHEESAQPSGEALDGLSPDTQGERVGEREREGVGVGVKILKSEEAAERDITEALAKIATAEAKGNPHFGWGAVGEEPIDLDDLPFE